MPEILPVRGLKVAHGGNVPVKTDQGKGATQLLVFSVWSYNTPEVPGGSVFVVITHTPPGISAAPFESEAPFEIAICAKLPQELATKRKRRAKRRISSCGQKAFAG